jgi:hypothetical protein
MISCRAQGGLTIERLIHERSDMFCFLHTSPKIIYLQMGGNDLSSTSSDIVANEVYLFASFLHYGIHIPIVVIRQLLWRDPSSTNQNYNDKVNEVNANLLHITRQDNNSCIIFWSDLSFLGRDGVHLNSNGMFKYMRSVRSAVLHASNVLGKVWYLVYMYMCILNTIQLVHKLLTRKP